MVRTSLSVNCGAGPPLSKTAMAKDIDHEVVHEAESGYDEVGQIHGSSNELLPYPLETPRLGFPNPYRPLPKTCTRGHYNYQ